MSPSHPIGDGDTAASIFVIIPALLVEFLLIFSLGFTLYYTIRYRSGFQEPDKVHRVWSRIGEIRLQPIPHPLLFSSITSYGAYNFTSLILLLVPVILNIHIPKQGAVAMILGGIVMTVSCGLAVAIYLVGGGSNWKTATLGSYSVLIGMYYGFIYFSGFVDQILEETQRQGMRSERASIVALSYGFIPLVMLGLQFLLSCWVSYLKMPATARKIYNTSVVPNWVKLDRSILIAAAPLVVIHLVGLTIQSVVGMGSYLSRLANYLSGIMLLAVSGLVAIISVNRALLFNEFEWQWRAFLTPAIPLACMDVIIHVFLTIIGKGHGFFLGLLQCVAMFFSYGASGVLAAYVYLILAEKYAHRYVDEDVAAQTDLLGEFADDDDNEELDV